MNLSLIEMERSAAIRAFEDYRHAVRARHDAEDEQLMKGYRELAAGRRLIDLRETMSEAGLVEVERPGRAPISMPRLAICDASSRRVWCEVRRNGSAWFCGNQRHHEPRIASGVTRDYVVLGPGTLPVHQDWSVVASAIVPIVPPALRPALSLAGYHVLWEAEWTLTAPGDPALLHHVGGDLWAVLATWDLTPLERSVVMGRIR